MVAGQLAHGAAGRSLTTVKSTGGMGPLLTIAGADLILAPRDKFPARGFKGNSGVKPGLPPQL